MCGVVLDTFMVDNLRLLTCIRSRLGTCLVPPPHPPLKARAVELDSTNQERAKYSATIVFQQTEMNHESQESAGRTPRKLYIVNRYMQDYNEDKTDKICGYLA